MSDIIDSNVCAFEPAPEACASHTFVAWQAKLNRNCVAGGVLMTYKDSGGKVHKHKCMHAGTVVHLADLKADELLTPG
jgi:hypothetical protein